MRAYLLPRLSVSAVFVALLVLSGCGVGTVATNSVGTLEMRGSLYGGQQPVSGASVKMYAAGKTGNGSAATSMLVVPVTSDAGGVFHLGGDYACANADDQVYLTATGGNPGLAAGTNNAALAMMTALGRCGDLSSITFVTINELTTVAAAWALAPFINSAANVGATATNAAGIANGFLNAGLLVDLRTGGLAAPTANLTVEGGKVYALGNSIASCVNSDGGAGCAALFSAATPSGGTAPTNTLGAVLNIVRNPGNNVAAVFNASSGFAPFPLQLTGAPHDWTMSMTVRGGALNEPTAVAVDKAGNVWVADYLGAVSDFTPQGTPILANGLGSGVVADIFGMTIDPFDGVWVTNEQSSSHGNTVGSITKLAGNSLGSPRTVIATYSDTSLNYPDAVSADTNGNIQVANYASLYGGFSVYNNSGSLLLGNAAVSGAAFPVAIATDSTHGMWLANSSDVTVSHVGSDGTLLARPTCCNEPYSIAVDALGNAWAANYAGSSVSEVSAAGAVTFANITGGGLSYPAGLTVDGAQDIWVANYRGTSISHVAGNGGAAPAGTVLSPSLGLGQDASLSLPFAIAVDPTGNVWVSNYGNNDVVMFFGLASPTKTPVTPTPMVP